MEKLEVIEIDPELARQHIANYIRMSGVSIENKEIDPELAKLYIENEIAAAHHLYNFHED